MKEKMSSAIFENLNPSDEQRKKMFDRIINEDAKIESEEISVRYVEENRFSLKNIIYPAAAAVIMICVIASALPALRNMDKQMAAENESLLTDEAGISAFPIDMNKQYRAVRVNNTGNENNIEFISDYLGTFEGRNCYLSETGCMYTDLWYTKNGDDSSPQRIELYDNPGKPNNGKPLNVTVTSVSAYGDSVLFMGYEAKDEGYSSVFLEYDPSLSILKRRFSVEGVSVYSYTFDDGIIYAVTDHPEGGLQIFVFGKDWSQTVRFDDLGLGSCTYVESMGMSPSGNIIIAAQSMTEKGKIAVFLDRDLNYIKSEHISDFKLQETSEVSINNGHISVLWKNDTDDSVSAECMMIDENDNITEVKTLPEDISEKLSGYSSCMASDSDYDFIIKKEDKYYGLNAENAGIYEIDGISGNDAQDRGFLRFMKVYDVAGTSEGTYSVVYKHESNIKLTADPYGISEDEIIYDWNDLGYNNYNSNYAVYLSGEHLYRLVLDSSLVRFTDISSSGKTVKTISMSPEKYEDIAGFVVAEEKYLVFLTTAGNKIYIYDTETEELRSVSGEKGNYVHDLFVTAEGEVIVTFSKKFTYIKSVTDNDNWTVWKIDLKEGKLTDAGISDKVFICAEHHQKGTDGYSAFCFTESGVYGMRKEDTGTVYDRILDLNNVDFEYDRYRSSIDGIYCDTNGDVYLRSEGYAFKLTEK